MKTPQHSPEQFTASDLFASGFDLNAIRKRIGTAIAKAKFNALPKSEQDKRAAEAMKTIKQLINDRPQTTSKHFRRLAHSCPTRGMEGCGTTTLAHLAHRVEVKANDQ